MNLVETLSTLESLGSEQTRKTYRRHGVPDPMFGVSYANFEKLRKKIKKDHQLALGLWASGNHDARILATMIADPKQADEALLDAWSKSLDCYAIADAFAKYVGQTSLAKTKMEQWAESDNDMVGLTGWTLVSLLASHDKTLSDDYFEHFLNTIKRTIHQRKNRTRYAMNTAVIAIGIRNPALQAQAISAARQIGKVEIDHGDTDCKTPDAESYILKTTARRK